MGSRGGRRARRLGAQRNDAGGETQSEAGPRFDVAEELYRRMTAEADGTELEPRLPDEVMDEVRRMVTEEHELDAEKDRHEIEVLAMKKLEEIEADLSKELEEAYADIHLQISRHVDEELEQLQLQDEELEAEQRATLATDPMLERVLKIEASEPADTADRGAEAAASSSSSRDSSAVGSSGAGDSANAQMLGEAQLRAVGQWIVDKEMKATQGSWDPVYFGLPPSEAIQEIGMGTWRLGNSMEQPFQLLASNIEGWWRQIWNAELQVSTLPAHLKFADSLADDLYSGEAAINFSIRESPEKGQPGYPRLLIENRVYATPQMRKMHMELACRQDGLQVLHCVMFPRTNYNIPILSMDLVGMGERVSLAIIDPCPVAKDRGLPDLYEGGMALLQSEQELHNKRSIPEWGQAIFSDYCICTRPKNQTELDEFLMYALSLTRFHLLFASNAEPLASAADVDEGTEDPEVQKQIAEIRNAHKRYCEMQLKNAKTRAVLAAAFDDKYADEYMSEVMFDYAD